MISTVVLFVTGLALICIAGDRLVDAAVAIAIHLAGSVEAFAQMMNEKAREIGANNSNFVTPNGLPDDNHYTTAYDLALISSYAMQN